MAGREKNRFEKITKEFIPSAIGEVLLKYRATVIDELVQNLEEVESKKKTPSSGELQQSIDVQIKRRGQIVSFELKMEDYWKFVDEGRKKGGKQPPIEAINEFMIQHGIGNKIIPQKRKQINTKVKTKRIRKALKQITVEKQRKQIGFLIGRSIKQHGIKPTHFYSSVINDDFKANLKKDLTIALGKDVAVFYNDLTE